VAYTFDGRSVHVVDCNSDPFREEADCLKLSSVNLKNRVLKHFKSAWFPQADRAQHILAMVFEDAPKEVAFVDVTNKQSPWWATLKLNFSEDIGDVVFVENYLALLFPDAKVVRVYDISKCDLDQGSCKELYHIDRTNIGRALRISF
jgi:hypothetical protein